MMSLSADSFSAFAHTLVAWQEHSGRHDLPWQPAGEHPDPYRVWLAEIMLQQTRVRAVIPYYTRFLDRTPNAEGLTFWTDFFVRRKGT